MSERKFADSRPQIRPYYLDDLKRLCTIYTEKPTKHLPLVRLEKEEPLRPPIHSIDTEHALRVAGTIFTESDTESFSVGFRSKTALFGRPVLFYNSETQNESYYGDIASEDDEYLCLKIVVSLCGRAALVATHNNDGERSLLGMTQNEAELFISAMSLALDRRVV